MSKSHVSVENKICPICGVQHSHGCAVLLDPKLRDTLERDLVTGLGLCKEHDDLHLKGRICFVAVSNGGPNLMPSTAKRTGEIAHVTPEFYAHAFKGDPPTVPFVYCDPDMIARLKMFME
jgi:hypothetical protein